MEHGQSRQCRRPTHAFRDQLLRNSEPSEPSYVRSGWLRLGLLSFVTSFYGNGGTKFPDKIQAVGKLAGSYEYTNTTGGNVLDGAISRAARAMPLQFGLFSLKDSVTVHLNMSQRENGQLPLAKRTVRSRISADIWEQIKTAHAGGIGLREIARNMNIPAGTILSRAKREGWTREIQSAKALAKREDSAPAVTATEAVAITMQQRGERHLGRMAGVSERGVDHVEKMAGNEILTSIDEIEKLDKVARRTFGLSDGGLRDNNLIVNVALLDIDPATVQVRSTDAEG